MLAGAEITAEARAVFGDAATYATAPVQTLLPRTGTAFVSPANSLCFMDGGVDAALRDMFPGIETIVRDTLPRVGKTTLLGRAYLPIGAALLTYDPATDSALVTAPTMLVPQPVDSTRNAEHAMRAAMRVFLEHNARRPNDPLVRLVVPALCCGWGEMTPRESVSQIRAALDDGPDHTKFWISEPSERQVLCMRETSLAEQPNYYVNTEWKVVAPADICTRGAKPRPTTL